MFLLGNARQIGREAESSVGMLLSKICPTKEHRSQPLIRQSKEKPDKRASELPVDSAVGLFLIADLASLDNNKSFSLAQRFGFDVLQT